MRERRHRLGRAGPTSSATVSTGGVLVLVLLASVLRPGGGTPADAAQIVLQGAGFGSSSTNLASFLLAVIVYLLPAIRAAARLEGELEGGVYAVLIRSRSFRRHLIREGAAACRFSVVYLLAVAGMVLLGSAIAPAPQVFAETDGETVAIVAYHYLVNGALQLVCTAASVWLVVFATGRAAAALIVLGGSVVLALAVPRQFVLVLPAFAGSLTRVQGGWEAVGATTAALVIATTAIGVALAFMPRVRGFIS